MKKLAEKLVNIDSLVLKDVDSNELLYAIIESENYQLLKEYKLRLNLDNTSSLERLIDLILDDDFIIYDIKKNGFFFTKNELNLVFEIINKKYGKSYKRNFFFDSFFKSNDELNEFVKDNETFFKRYIEESKPNFSRWLERCENFIGLVLQSNDLSLVKDIENYSSSNLKLLAKNLQQSNNLPYGLQGDNEFAQHLFEVKDNLSAEEFLVFLNLFVNKNRYEKQYGSKSSQTKTFSDLIMENMEYLIDVVTKTNSIPRCLVESIVFSKECVKRKRVDLATKCLFLPEAIKNKDFALTYCKELNLTQKEFDERRKWILDYYKKNNNVFNTLLASSLKNDIFSINKEHYERFINDIEVQISISKLNHKELSVLTEILNMYDYKDYDTSIMINNIINNLDNYAELINYLELEKLSKQDLKNLVSVLQLKNNQYQIDNVEKMQNYNDLKSEYFIKNYSNNLVSNKENLLKLLFNIDLKEAKYIDFKYCHDNKEKNMLEDLKNSELPQKSYNYLFLINKIVECNDSSYLYDLYNKLNGKSLYLLEIPIEAYLRGQYTELYSKSLYKIGENRSLTTIDYNGKKVKICFPKSDLNLFVHSLGTCTKKDEITDTNYKNDWLYRPQIQDHFVACSYLNEEGLYSIRDERVIFGFDTLENGSILGMGNTDIDSIGSYGKSYIGSRILQEVNGVRARFFVPSEILKYLRLNGGYNEIVIERRNVDLGKNQEFKRAPNYIIMMSNNVENDSLYRMEEIYQNQLSFLNDEDKKLIMETSDNSKIKECLVKYKEVITKRAQDKAISATTMAYKYMELIKEAKCYEECLKAASEFEIPLLVVDRTYYFNKMLNEKKIFDDKQVEEILQVYSNANVIDKRQIFNKIVKGEDPMKFIEDLKLKEKSIKNR